MAEHRSALPEQRRAQGGRPPGQRPAPRPRRGDQEGPGRAGGQRGSQDSGSEDLGRETVVLSAAPSGIPLAITSGSEDPAEFRVSVCPARRERRRSGWSPPRVPIRNHPLLNGAMSLPHPCELSGVLRISFRSIEFRMDYYRLAMSILLPGFVLGELTTWLQGASLFEILVLIPLLTVSVAFLGAFPFWWYYRYQVGPDGVHGYDFWGRRVRIEWDRIDAARVPRFS